MLTLCFIQNQIIGCDCISFFLVSMSWLLFCARLPNVRCEWIWLLCTTQKSYQFAPQWDPPFSPKGFVFIAVLVWPPYSLYPHSLPASYHSFRWNPFHFLTKISEWLVSVWIMPFLTAFCFYEYLRLPFVLLILSFSYLTSSLSQFISACSLLLETFLTVSPPPPSPRTGDSLVCCSAAIWDQLPFLHLSTVSAAL